MSEGRTWTVGKVCRREEMGTGRAFRVIERSKWVETSNESEREGEEEEAESTVGCSFSNLTDPSSKKAV